METIILLETLRELAESLGIPFIQRGGLITLIGEKEILEFNYLEETQCRLKTQTY